MLALKYNFAKFCFVGWGVGLTLLVVLAIEVLWYCLSNGYYRKRFGWLKPASCHPAPKGQFYKLFILLLIVVCLYYMGSHSRSLLSYMPYLFALIMMQPVFDAGNFKIRRVIYSVAGVLIAAAASVSWLSHSDESIGFVTVCFIMFALGLADHLLLISLRTPVQENADA